MSDFKILTVHITLNPKNQVTWETDNVQWATGCITSFLTTQAV